MRVVFDITPVSLMNLQDLQPGEVGLSTQNKAYLRCFTHPLGFTSEVVIGIRLDSGEFVTVSSNQNVGSYRGPQVVKCPDAEVYLHGAAK